MTMCIIAIVLLIVLAHCTARVKNLEEKNQSLREKLILLRLKVSGLEKEKMPAKKPLGETQLPPKIRRLHDDRISTAEAALKALRTRVGDKASQLCELGYKGDKLVVPVLAEMQKELSAWLEGCGVAEYELRFTEILVSYKTALDRQEYFLSKYADDVQTFIVMGLKSLNNITLKELEKYNEQN